MDSIEYPCQTPSSKARGMYAPIPRYATTGSFSTGITMGWTESPPYLCCFTETACDLANKALNKNQHFPEHRLEPRASAGGGKASLDSSRDNYLERPVMDSHQKSAHTRPMAYLEVFVDGFCGLGKDHKMNSLKKNRGKTSCMSSTPYSDQRTMSPARSQFPLANLTRRMLCGKTKRGVLAGTMQLSQNISWWLITNMTKSWRLLVPHSCRSGPV
jgi:hypothetical protein